MKPCRLALIAAAVTVVSALCSTPASAADLNALYTNHSPYTQYRGADGSYSCAESQQVISADYLRIKNWKTDALYAVGAVQLVRSNRCHTYWGRVVFWPRGMSNPVQPYNCEAGFLSRYHDGSPAGHWRTILSNDDRSVESSEMVYAPSSTVTFQVTDAGEGCEWLDPQGNVTYTLDGATVRMR